MIINTTKVKSEALLLFCRDLITSYQKSNTNQFEILEETVSYVDNQIEDILKAINITTQPIDYYLRNQKVSRIAFILRGYEYLNRQISKSFQQGDNFNPSMLCFALLCSWFAELSMSKEDKEFIYFTIYPYTEVYDKLLLNNSDESYRNLNIKMLTIAENTIVQFHKYRFTKIC